MLTAIQIKKAMAKHKYLILRNKWGIEYGINCSILPIIEKTKSENRMLDHELTGYFSWRPCSFSEYVSKKAGFVFTCPPPR